jgi:hypothetical protein
MNLAQPLPTQLTTALQAYQQAFGHPVPAEVIEMYATRSGPLLLEIRQAIALQRPVKAWLERSRVG